MIHSVLDHALEHLLPYHAHHRVEKVVALDVLEVHHRLVLDAIIRVHLDAVLIAHSVVVQHAAELAWVPAKLDVVQVAISIAPRIVRMIAVMNALVDVL